MTGDTSTQHSQSLGTVSVEYNQCQADTGEHQRDNPAQYHDMWDLPSQVGVPSKAVCSLTKVSTVTKPKQSALVQSEQLSSPIPADLPFMNAIDLPTLESLHYLS